MTRQRHSGTGTGGALSGLNCTTCWFTLARAHRKCGCAHYPLEVFRSTVGALHFNFFLVPDQKDLKDLVTFQTPKFI
jgi:hypothetical protein